MFNIHDIAQEIKRSFSRNDIGCLEVKLEIDNDAIDYSPIWAYSVCLYVNGDKKKKFKLFEIGDVIGSQDNHKKHMQMTIYQK